MDASKPMSLQIADRTFIASAFLVVLVFWAGWLTGEMKTVLIFLLGAASNNLGAALGALQGDDPSKKQATTTTTTPTSTTTTTKPSE